MALIVQKFGGTSVGSHEMIKRVAGIIYAEWKAGNKVVVIASAMSGVTNELVAHATAFGKIRTSQSLAEYDAVLGSGEQVSCGLLALALQALGLKARSWAGWQVPIITDNSFSNAKILSVGTEPLLKALDNDEIPVITGFQGVYNGRITTLGRGGSDTTATAVAVALGAARCDIYTDVDGVYTSDPRIVSKAKKLKQVAFDEMLEMASSGARVLHSRCVEMAMKFNLKMRVLSSFDDTEGTMIVSEEEILEKQMVTGVTCRGDVSGITLKGITDAPGSASKLFAVLKENGIYVDVIVQNIGSRGRTDITFTIEASALDRTLYAIKNSKQINYREIIVDDNIAKVSVIGVGMKSHSGVAQKMFQILADRGINILAISTSEIKISVLIHAECKELAVRALHTGYGLDK